MWSLVLHAVSRPPSSLTTVSSVCIPRIDASARRCRTRRCARSVETLQCRGSYERFTCPLHDFRLHKYRRMQASTFVACSIVTLFPYEYRQPICPYLGLVGWVSSRRRADAESSQRAIKRVAKCLRRLGRSLQKLLLAPRPLLLSNNRWLVHRAVALRRRMSVVKWPKSPHNCISRANTSGL